MLTTPQVIQAEESETSKDRPDISIIIPAYNEAAVIGQVIAQVAEMLGQADYSFEIVVVDDGSTDSTAEAARQAGARVVQHPYNIGNGAAVKSGIRAARGRTLVMMDGDGQHSPADVLRLLEYTDRFDMVVGARSRASQTDFHRDVANTIYNVLATYICGRRIEDLTSGFRAVKAEIARGVLYLLPNSFSYPTTMTLAVIRSGHSLQYIPIVTRRRVGRSKIHPLRDGVRFLTIILRIAVFFAPLRVFVPTSIILFSLGFGWYVYAVFFLGRGFPPTSILVMLTSVLIFFMGLISEQITQLRHDRME